MPAQEGKKPTKAYKKPEITDLGRWPEAENRIRERALAQGMPSEDVEILLNELREARRVGQDSADDGELKAAT
jgi:hypothetical protein